MVALVLLLLGGTTAAAADGGPVGADLHVAQTVGERELTVVIRRTDGAPAPLRVDVVAHAGDPGGVIRVRAVPTGARAVSEAAVELRQPGPVGVSLSVDRFGAWELELDDGTHVARIPFTVPERITPAWERTAFGGFVAAGVFLLAALVMAPRGGRKALVPAAGVVASVAVGITAALLSATVGPKAVVDTGRPPVALAVTPDSEAKAGQGVWLSLDWYDAATGRPVDDLLVHHGALVHLAIISPNGTPTHVHPMRVGPGRYRILYKPAEPGRHAMAAEIARAGGGQQQIRAEVEVAPGTSQKSTVDNTGKVDTGAPVAGRPATLTADFGGPDDLQPWLGMRGHLILVGPGETLWAHAHALTSPMAGGQPDESVAAYPAKVSFTFTFPTPGRYRLWFQAERDYRILTLPAVVDVAPGGSPR
ncbi:hypothetical protein [Actinokineospora auranticolor]|uniref:hypothetical protein n=1 Tax=Actinokineospora auranticolor TaxID=155976 RepID=UPI003183409C